VWWWPLDALEQFEVDERESSGDDESDLVPTGVAEPREVEKKMGRDMGRHTTEEYATQSMIAKAHAAGIEVITLPINDRESVLKKMKDAFGLFRRTTRRCCRR